MKQASPKKPGANKDRYLVPGLARGLELLSCFSRQEPVFTGAELARRLDVPRASLFRMLQTLEQLGYVERVAGGAHYKLGIGVLRLGFEYLASLELAEHGRAVVDSLRDQSGYSAQVVVRDGVEAVVVVKASGHSALFSTLQVGARLPAHATVLGRVLLSDLSFEELQALYHNKPLKRYTEHTPTHLKALKTLIDGERQKGYAISQGGFETGINTIAVPVFNEQAKVVAAVSVTVPAQHMVQEQLDELLPLVQEAARQLTARLNHINTVS